MPLKQQHLVLLMEQIVYQWDYVHHTKNLVVIMGLMVNVFMIYHLGKYKEQNHVDLKFVLIIVKLQQNYVKFISPIVYQMELIVSLRIIVRLISLKWLVILVD